MGPFLFLVKFNFFNPFSNKKIPISFPIFFFMTRVKRGRGARRRRKKVLSLVKGSIGSSSLLFLISKQNIIKAIRQSYSGRREKKRKYRSFWIVRLNAIVRFYSLKYSSFLSYLRVNKYLVNRKILAQLAVLDPSVILSLIL